MTKQHTEINGIKLPYFEDISTYKKYFGEQNINHWNLFFNFFDDKNLEILDFGCGAAWSIHLGKKLGYNITGLDVKDLWFFKHFNEFREALGVAKYVKLYGGAGTLPFDDSSFSLVVCRGSFNKFGNLVGVKGKRNIILGRLDEFSRILREPRIVVIAGGYFLKFRDEFEKRNLKTYLWGKKKIKPAWERIEK